MLCTSVVSCLVCQGEVRARDPCGEFASGRFFVYCCVLFGYSFFFFSSRRRHTRCLSDWSSDVCSSDLEAEGFAKPVTIAREAARAFQIERPREGSLEDDVLGADRPVGHARHAERLGDLRSEERRVGKEWRSRWSPCHAKKERTKRAER